jgi:hypothetical protein
MPIPIGFAQINMFFTGASLPTGAQCALGFDISGAASSPAAVGADFNTTWNATGVMVRLATGYDYAGCLVKFGPDATGPSARVTASIGPSGGTGASPNVTWLIRKNTQDGGRSGRGRWYLPGVPEAAVGSDGAMSGTAVTNLQGDIDELIGLWAADGLIPVVLHETGAPITTPSEITSFTVDGRAATQRRRMRR